MVKRVKMCTGTSAMHKFGGKVCVPVHSIGEFSDDTSLRPDFPGAVVNKILALYPG